MVRLRRLFGRSSCVASVRRSRRAISVSCVVVLEHVLILIVFEDGSDLRFVGLEAESMIAPVARWKGLKVEVLFGGGD